MNSVFLKGFLFLLFFCRFIVNGQSEKVYTTFKEAISDSTEVVYLDIKEPVFNKIPDKLSVCENIEEVSFRYVGDLNHTIKVLAKLPQLKKLSLIDNQIETLPKSIGSLVNLEELNLEDNLIKTLKCQFNTLSNLKILNLNYNKIDTIHPCFYNIPSLKELHLDGNKIKYLSDSIQNLENLSTLNLQGNKLKEIPEKLSKLKNLIDVDFSRNRFQSADPVLKIETLEKLNVSGNPIVEFKSPTLIQLTYLNISNTQLKDFPDTQKFPNLKKLKASFLPIELITLEIKCDKIEHLDIRSSNIQDIDLSSLKNKNLIYLDASFNNLSNSSLTHIFEVQTLEKLFLIECNISKIEDFQKGSHLKELILDNNQITTVSSSIGFLKNLELLSLYNNQIQDLPLSINKLIHLNELELGRNNFSTFPIFLSQLPNLKTLNIQRNNIQSIGRLDGPFTALRELDLGVNNISSIPSQVFKLKLEQLDISENPITTLPDDFWTNSNYKELNLSGLQQLELKFNSAMNKLIELDLSKIEFETFPSSIMQLPALEILELSSNDKIEEQIDQFISKNPNITVNY